MLIIVTFDVPTAMTMKIIVFLDVRAYNVLEFYQFYRGSYCASIFMVRD
jgi:hypothetical protein